MAAKSKKTIQKSSKVKVQDNLVGLSLQNVSQDKILKILNNSFQCLRE